MSLGAKQVSLNKFECSNNFFILFHHLISFFSEITVSARQSVELGEHATITCAVTGNDATPSITWSNSGGPVVDDSNFDILSTAGRSVLTVKVVNSTTPSVYTCNVIFDETSFGVPAEITVYVFEVADIDGIAGEKVELPCTFESATSTITSATIQKLTNAVWTSQSDSVFSTTGNKSTITLTLSPAASSDEGQFRCIAIDDKDMTFESATFNLDIAGRSFTIYI